jgi:hypothetical protein
MAVRGSGGGLSWEENTGAEWTPGNVWQFSTTAVTTAVEWKPVFIHSNGAHLVAEWGELACRARRDRRRVTRFFFSLGGRLEERQVASVVYSENRTVTVYLPPSYDELGASAREYPVLVMHDGQNLYDPFAIQGGWQMQGTLDNLLVHSQIVDGEGVRPMGGVREMIVVGVWNTPDRIYEYTPTNASFGGCDAAVSSCGGGADEYLDFIETDLLPTLAPLYRIDDDQRLGVAGSSLGGSCRSTRAGRVRKSSSAAVCSHPLSGGTTPSS